MDKLKKNILILIPYLWLFVFFLVPFLIVVKISLSDTNISIPPYIPVFEFSQGLSSIIEAIKKFDLENYVWIFEDNLYIKSYLSSVKIAFVSTVLALIVGYPIAYGMFKAPKQWRSLLIMLVILPFWTSFLIRVYSWIGILKPEGFLSQFLQYIGLIDQNLQIFNTEIAVYIGIVYSYLPFMILPLYANLEKMDISLIEAAKDLGCRNYEVFYKITFPLSMPGVIAGCFLIFIPAIGEFVIPDLLGGSDTLMIGKTLWVEFFSNRDWPVASAVTVLLLLILIIPIVFFQKQQEKEQLQS